MTSPAHTPNFLLEAALAYAARGWPVFPVWWIRESGRCACGGSKCDREGKHPLGDLVPNGRNQASLDPEVIRFWWSKFPNARIGIATGGELGVIDVDPRHAGDETIADVQRSFGQLPDTPTALTPSGGYHLFFRKSAFLKSKVGALGPGVDTRGDGGYVVAAPSPGYAWDAARDLELPLAELPEWVYRLVNLGAKAPDEHSAAPSAPTADIFIEGGRNESLTKLAGAMRRKGMDGEEILGALLVSNRKRCRPPLDEAEVKRIAYGMERYEATDPVRPGDSPDPKSDKFLDPIERARRLGLRGTRLPTDFATLDKATRGGPLSGRTLVLGGAPGAGKTTLAVQLVRGYAMAGHPVLVVASDEEADGLLIRWGQNENLDRDALEKGDDGAKDVLVERLAMCGTLMLVDQDEDDATFEEAVEEFVKRMQATEPPQNGAVRKPPVIVVDSLQTLRCRAHDEIKTVRERLDSSVKAIKRTAKKLDALLIATSELARGSYRNRDASERIDDLAAFKESGGIEYGVTTAIVLRSEAGGSGNVEVSMPKNRLGPMMGFRLSLDRKNARFTEVATTPAQAPGTVGRALPPEERLRAVERLILEQLRQHLELSANGIYERVQARRQTVLVALEQLAARGVVMCTGKGPKARFTLASAPGREDEGTEGSA